ncbi:MAG: nucleotidyl transferase AbiEii/AbiGii toxin family protein [Acidobacteria bacterium]|nr:nucleotidyl transferase AbiEii/AbiGii toxin family protein [Acidobacteriota bacterium]
MSGRDLGASVRQRLLNQARSQGRPFQELLQYFAMERFLYRLAKSPFADRFILKGALLLTAWRAPVARPTMDIDLAGKTMQIDIGFGDVIVPQPIEIEYPAMLEFPAPVLMAYPRETVVAEKLEALTMLGLLNSRIKDYYDIALLARLYPFDGDLLTEAIRSTFRHRGTTIDATPVGLTEAYSADPARAVQWRAFVRRSRFESESGLDEIVAQVRRFASAPLAATAREDSFARAGKGTDGGLGSLRSS